MKLQFLILNPKRALKQQLKMSSPLPCWDEYFEDKTIVEVPNEYSGESEPFCVYSAGPEDAQVCFVFLHGGGHTSMSWALVCKLLKEKYQVLAIDFRGHGSSVFSGHLSAQQLSADVVAIMNKVCKPSRPIILVGHSVGGGIAVHVSQHPRLPKQVMGLAVLDVVEGTALAALPLMPMIISKRPKSFPSLQEAIDWSLHTCQLSQRESARISIPDQLFYNENTQQYEWRTDLLGTQDYWEGWYSGMSERFVSAPLSKLLILAGQDRLEKETVLTIAQMQGKFQMKIVASSGHSIQEDRPEEVASTLASFADRNRFAEMARLNAARNK